jgi:hypothetical protein
MKIVAKEVAGALGPTRLCGRSISQSNFPYFKIQNLIIFAHLQECNVSWYNPLKRGILM